MSSGISFDFAADNSRDLVVGTQSISILGRSADMLLPKPVLSFVDATVPHIWLPLEACKAFEKAFGIPFDVGSDLISLIRQSTTPY